MNGFHGESHPVFWPRFFLKRYTDLWLGCASFECIYLYIYILSYMYIYCMHTCFYMSVGSARYIPLLMVRIWVVPQGKIRWTPQKHHGIYRKKTKLSKTTCSPHFFKRWWSMMPQLPRWWGTVQPKSAATWSTTVQLWATPVAGRIGVRGLELWGVFFLCHARSFFICSFVFLL